MKKIVLMLDDILLVLSMTCFVIASYLANAVRGTYTLAAVLLIGAVLAAMKLGGVNAEQLKGMWKRGKK